MPSIDNQQFSAVLPNGTTGKPTAGTITIDESWSPYAQATITVPMPATLAAFDPRLPSAPRVVVNVQQDFTDADAVSVFTATFGGGTVAALSAAFGSGTVAAITAAHNRPWTPGEYRRRVIRKFDLGIRRRSRGPDNTLVLTLASDEALLQDIAPLMGGGGDEGPVGGGVLAAGSLSELVSGLLQATLGATLAPTDVNVDLSPYREVWGPGTPGLGIEWPAGVTAWDFINEFVQLAGARLWCDENRVWHLDRAPLDFALSLTVASAVSLLDFTDEISRDADWYDAAVVVYNWTNAAGATFYTTDYARADYLTPYTRTYVVNRDLGKRSSSFMPPTGAAAGLLAQVSVLGRLVPVAAVNDFNATPGSALTITLPDAAPLNGRLSSVSWGIDSRQMKLSTRNMT